MKERRPGLQWVSLLYPITAEGTSPDVSYSLGITHADLTPSSIAEAMFAEGTHGYCAVLPCLDAQPLEAGNIGQMCFGHLSGSISQTSATMFIFFHRKECS